MGSLAEWLLAFRALHEKARRGQLRGAEVTRYQAARDELARALLTAQRLQLKPGETPRAAMRVACALQVELSLPATTRGTTADVSTGGFSCLLGPRGAPAPRAEVGFSLKLPGGATITGRARVQDVKPLAGSLRLSFMFTALAAGDRERLELLVIDTALAQLTRS